MKKIILAIMMLGIAPVLMARPKAGDLGLGVVLGDVSGPTIKYFSDSKMAFDAGIGFESEYELYGDVVWHAWDIFPRPQVGTFGGYLGAGPRYKQRDHGDDKFGVRALGGVDYWTARYPFEFFVELAPWFVFTPDTDTEIDFGVGLRYYFTGRK